jgi:phage tail-like protein
VKQEAIVERLPDVFKQAAASEDGRNPLAALLGVMEKLHAPDEEILSGFGRYVDPRRTPDKFVPYLAAWVDYAWLLLDPPDNPYTDVIRPFAGGLGRLRELIAFAASESKWRGTRDGLIRLLERATGVEGYRVEETVYRVEKTESGDVKRQLPFQVRVIVPREAERYFELVERIVEHEKPAHVVANAELEHAGS